MLTRPKSRLVFRTENTPKFSEEDVERIELTAVAPNLEWNIGRRIVFESELKQQQYEHLDSQNNPLEPLSYERSPQKSIVPSKQMYTLQPDEREDINKYSSHSPDKISFAAPGSKHKHNSFGSPNKSEASSKPKPRWSNSKQLSSGSKGNPFVSNHKHVEQSLVGTFSANKNSSRLEPIGSRTPPSVRGPVSNQQTPITNKNDTQRSLAVPSTPKSKPLETHVWVAEVKRETKIMEQRIQDFERKFEERTSMRLLTYKINHNKDESKSTQIMVQLLLKPDVNA